MATFFTPRGRLTQLERQPEPESTPQAAGAVAETRPAVELEGIRVE